MARIGMLTPSSNTVLEPVTYEMLAGVPDITAHFSRFKVTEIALSKSALGQFDDAPILAAAELLAHAKCDVIAWNGTSASWLGFERDEALVRGIEQATGIASATCVLGYRALLEHMRPQRIGLVTPYTADVQGRIIANWAKAGLHVGAERHVGLKDNFSFAAVSQAEIARSLREVAEEGCDCAVVLCTNMRGATAAARIEKELDMPVLDSVAVTLWAALRAIDAPTRGLMRWGGPFRILEGGAESAQI